LSQAIQNTSLFGVLGLFKALKRYISRMETRECSQVEPSQIAIVAEASMIANLG
jgi:hypothetical protein